MAKFRFFVYLAFFFTSFNCEWYVLMAYCGWAAWSEFEQAPYEERGAFAARFGEFLYAEGMLLTVDVGNVYGEGWAWACLALNFAVSVVTRTAAVMVDDYYAHKNI